VLRWRSLCARHSSRSRDIHFSTRWLAEDFGFSEAHLAKVLQQLARHNIIKSIRGAHGGFQIATDPETLKVAKVIEAIDGPLEVSPSVSDEVRPVEEKIVKSVKRALNGMKVVEL